MILRPPKSTRTDTLFPYTTLFRSHLHHGPRAIFPHGVGDIARSQNIGLNACARVAFDQGHVLERRSMKNKFRPVVSEDLHDPVPLPEDRKSTRLNSSH